MPRHAFPASELGMMVRQGDILIVGIDDLPRDCRRLARDGASIVLAHGEATTQRHRIASPHASLHARGDERYLVVTAPVELVHDEHATIALAPGIYRVVRQREYAPRSPPRRVAD